MEVVDGWEKEEWENEEAKEGENRGAVSPICCNSFTPEVVQVTGMDEVEVIGGW